MCSISLVNMYSDFFAKKMKITICGTISVQLKCFKVTTLKVEE